MLVLLLVCSSVVAQQKLSYTDLVDRLTDFEFLALTPPGGERGEQWSSYDRASRYEETGGKYVGWDANGDGNGIIRREGDKQVMAEMQGPGCIYRIWSAMPGKGHVRIYLDGASEPASDLPFISYFDRKTEPFIHPALVHEVARGWNNYVPIAYQKSCKIVAENGWGQRTALANANAALTLCGPQSGKGKVAARGKLEGQGVGKATSEILGAGAISCIRVRIADLPASPADLDALRTATISIRWDGEAEPSIWSPLGDFFGTAPGLDAYRSFPLGLGADGWWYCNWFMPFGKSAEVSFEKEARSPLKLQYEIFRAPLKQKVGNYGRFHAKWHRDAFLPAEPERAAIDWTILRTTGSGRFVGVMLHIWNPKGSWWGEGDEKFHVDGEKFPSTIGTGSEDYFGYAWCDPRLFQNAYHNQTRNDGNNRGHVSVNRWHFADSIPFQKSFEGYIEKYYPNKRPTLYAGTAYWYLDANGTDPYRRVPVAERVGYWVPIDSFKAKGALEGESLKLLSKTGGEPQPQDLADFAGEWSNGAHLWWINAKPGARMEVGFPVAAAGAYELIMQLTKAPDYGIHQLYLDGQKLGEPIDLYNRAVSPTGELKMGTHQLTTGQHKLGMEIIGANEKAIKGYMFGLDYLKLNPVQ